LPFSFTARGLRIVAARPVEPVNATRRNGYGFEKCSLIVWESGVSIASRSPSFQAWIGACCLSFTRSRFHLTSAAVSGSPLWNVTPLCRRKTCTRSPWISHSRATSGLKSTLLPSDDTIFSRPL
jgi:hypothetical protein